MYARRVCIIGNSSVGAVRLALADRATDSYEFGFFASGGSNFDDLTIADDLIVGAQVENAQERALSKYDAFIIHGRFPPADRAPALELQFASERFSQSVRRLAREDWLKAQPPWTLGMILKQRYGKPVLIMTRNVFADECVGDEPQRREANAAFSRLIAPLDAVPLPDALFDAEGRVRREFFVNHVNVHGRVGSASEPDPWHYNREGGALILDQLLQRLDATFASDQAPGANAARSSSSHRESAGDEAAIANSGIDAGAAAPTDAKNAFMTASTPSGVTFRRSRENASPSRDALDTNS